MKERMRHIALGGVATILGGALFLFLVYKAGAENIYHNVRAFGLPALLGFVGISLANFCLYTLRWKIILQEIEKKPVHFWRLFLHRMSGFATGYVTPGAQVAGEPVRVALLATEGISVKTATSSVVLDLAFEIGTFVLYVTLGMVLALVTGIGAGVVSVFAYAALGALMFVLVIFFLSVARGWNFFQTCAKHTFFTKHRRLHAWMTWLSGVENIMTGFFQGKVHKLFIVVVLSCIMTGFRAIEIMYIGWGFEQDISLSGAILLSTIPGLVLLVPVPGGLGLFEASTAAMFAALGVGAPAIAFTFVIRLRDAVFILIGALHGIREGAGWIGRRK